MEEVGYTICYFGTPIPIASLNPNIIEWFIFRRYTDDAYFNMWTYGGRNSWFLHQGCIVVRATRRWSSKMRLQEQNVAVNIFQTKLICRLTPCVNAICSSASPGGESLCCLNCVHLACQLTKGLTQQALSKLEST